MRSIEQLASELLLTTLPNSPVGREITQELQTKYTMTDEEWPEAYYAELSEYYQKVFERAAQLALPTTATN